MEYLDIVYLALRIGILRVLVKAEHKAWIILEY